MTVRRFFNFSIVYLAIAIALAGFVHPRGLAFVNDTFEVAQIFTGRYLLYLQGFAAFVLVMKLANRGDWTRARIVDLIMSAIAMIIFGFSFSLIKSCFPFIIGFWADPPFAVIDRVMHFGVDPWVMTHAILPRVNPDWLTLIYFKMWSFPAVFAPFLLVLFDRDPARIARFLKLHIFVWVGLGNLMALAFLSVGPIYYDRLEGGTAFADLISVLETSGVGSGQMGFLQDWLWKSYLANGQELGSGISAFPSVHVAVATLTTVYLYERSKPLCALAGAYLAVILFLSVYTGFHYAIDGYIAILAVVLAWHLQRRWTPAATRNNTKSLEKPQNIDPIGS